MDDPLRILRRGVRMLLGPVRGGKHLVPVAPILVLLSNVHHLGHKTVVERDRTQTQIAKLLIGHLEEKKYFIVIRRKQKKANNNPTYIQFILGVLLSRVRQISDLTTRLGGY